MNKRILIILTGLALVIVAAFAVVQSSKQGEKSPPSAGTQVSKDPDTGDTIYHDTTKPPEVQTSGLVSIYGGDKIYNLMSNDQYSLLRESITFFVKSNISTKIDTVKALPETIKSTDDAVNFTLKTVNPEKLILIKTSLYNSQSIQITYINPDDNSVIYQTGYLPEDPSDIPTGD